MEPMSPPEGEVVGFSEKFMAREPKSSPLSTRFLRARIFLRASSSEVALEPWRLPGRGIGGVGDEDLGDVVLGLDVVEFGFVLGEVGGDVGVGNVDFAVDFLVEELVGGEGAAEVALDVVDGGVAVGEACLELVFGVGRLHFGEFGVDLFGGGGEVHFGGALLDDFIEDELLEERQLERGGLLGGGLFLLLGGVAELVVVGAVELGGADGVRVDGGDDVGRGGTVAAGGGEQSDGEGQGY